MILFTERQRTVIAKQIRHGIRTTVTEKARRKRFTAHLGVSPSTVSRWMLGQTMPSIKHLILISEILNIPIHKLCGFSGTRLAQTKNIAFNNMINMSIMDDRTTFSTRGVRRATEKVMQEIWEQLEGLPKTS